MCAQEIAISKTKTNAFYFHSTHTFSLSLLTRAQYAYFRRHTDTHNRRFPTNPYEYGLFATHFQVDISVEHIHICVCIQIAVYVYFTNLLNCAYGAYYVCISMESARMKYIFVLLLYIFIGVDATVVCFVAVVLVVVVMQMQIGQNQK